MKNWEHREREQRRPLHEKAKHYQDEADILRMADIAVGSRGGQSVTLLRVTQTTGSV